jgi:hypothetical protein
MPISPQLLHEHVHETIAHGLAAAVPGPCSAEDGADKRWLLECVVPRGRRPHRVRGRRGQARAANGL